MRVIELEAPAKLNLHLGIYSELDNRGYHRADSLMVAVGLCDQVEVRETSNVDSREVDGTVHVDCVPPVGIPEERNTAHKAVLALAGRVDRVPNVQITIHKGIPDQAGMGGSSSDAAAVLRALCELWDINPRDALVADAARSVGADVPFFLDPVPTLLVGAGDVVDKKFAPLAQPIPVALVRPKGPGVSTPAAYHAFDECPSPPASPQALCEVLQSDPVTASRIAKHLHNNLDPVACRLLPKVAEVRTWLAAQEGALGVQVTGSGSCVFAICAASKDADRIADAARANLGAWACSTHIA